MIGFKLYSPATPFHAVHIKGMQIITSLFLPVEINKLTRPYTAHGQSDFVFNT